jgi:hypothetical protein
VIRSLFILVMVGVGFGAYTVKKALFGSTHREKIVYCPLGTTDPECAHARRLYETGKIAAPSGRP